MAAVQLGKLATLKWMHENGFPWHKKRPMSMGLKIHLRWKLLLEDWRIWSGFWRMDGHHGMEVHWNRSPFND